MKMEKTRLKEPCTEKCKKKCSTKFTVDERQEINARYNALNYESQGIFIKRLIDKIPISHRSKVSANYIRKITYKYYLNGYDDIKKEVCKTFFLTTLGYHANNGTRIATAMNKPLNAQKMSRGKYQRSKYESKRI